MTAKEILEQQLARMEAAQAAMGELRVAFVRDTDQLEALVRDANDDDMRRRLVRSLRAVSADLVGASADLERIVERIARFEGKPS